MKSRFSVCSGPDCYHWHHTVSIHETYKSALVAYLAIPDGWSAVILRLDHKPWAIGKRTVKRMNQHNYGHAIAWCDELNRVNGNATVAP